MCRRWPRQFLLSALLATAIACSDGGDTSLGSTTGASPSVGNITETFVGTLTSNSSTSFPFASSSSGSISATLTSFTPPNTTLKVGLWLGVWDGARCLFGVVNDQATGGDPTATTPVGGSVVTGFATGAGSWCVKIFDSTGTVTVPETYQIDVTHP